MLINLDWLKEGEPFPPKSEKERLKRYQENRLLFEAEHVQVYREQLKRIERVIGNFDDIVSYPIVITFQKLMSLKIADLLLGEPPTITSLEKDSLKSIFDNNDVLNTAYQCVVDISRYGDGLFLITKQGDHGSIGVTQPSIWFPVISPDNVQEVTYHVLAWTIESDTKLKVQIHSKGFCDNRVYEINKFAYGTIIGKLISSETVATGLTDFAVVQVSNVLTSDRCTGIDDYGDIDSIVADIMVRVGQIDRILDKHANPSMQGPETVMERDPVSGDWRLKVGSYFARDPADVEVSYITWNGQLDANFKQIERLMNLLYSTSEMGSALFGDMSTMTGQVPSGSALKRLMISPLAKVNRVRMRLDPLLKKTLILCSQLGGKVLESVSITWQDGLPGDPKEEAEIMQIRTNFKPTMSQNRALKTYDMMDAESIEEEMGSISDEEMANNPLKPPPFSTTPVSEAIDETVAK